MKHLAARSMSVHHPDRPFTTPGLGDRIHHATVAWAYGQGEPVTLHLTADKWRGGRFNNKPESWREIVALFPPGRVELRVHAVEGLSERQWLEYLRPYGAVGFWYSDHPGLYEPPAEVDIAPYLRDIPRLAAAPQDFVLPERFVTMQFDSQGAGRALSVSARAHLVSRYVGEGYVPLMVGGEADEDRLRWSLAHIAWAMANADLHVGVDSAFMHLAQLYLPPDRIHLFGSAAGSHHARRAADRGIRWNPPP